MICPLRLAGFGGLSNFEEEPFGCQKEKCAWWVEESRELSSVMSNTTAQEQRPPNYKDISGCAIKLMAERKA